MELAIFARFHALEGREADVEATIREEIPQARAEPGCLAISAYRSTRDQRLFWIHSRWLDEAAFKLHATLPHTVHFIERIEPLVDHRLDVGRARRLEV